MDYNALKSGSDIRGTAVGDNVVLTEEFSRNIGAAFVDFICKKLNVSPAKLRIAIGRDSRVSGESLLNAACEGICKSGANVSDCGLSTTPSMYQALLTKPANWDASIMVTASHHPWMKNGFKFFLPEGGLTGKDIETLLSSASKGFTKAKVPGIKNKDSFMPEYIKSLKILIKNELHTNVAMPLLGLHVIVDAGNGAGGFYAEMLKDLGADINGSQFLNPDGKFPNHIPNPENSKAMDSISKAVIKHKADIGVIFDTDCDRAAIVDHNGKEINRNRLIAMISSILLAEKKGLTIVTDSVTSSGLAQFITEKGGIHYRFKRGYRNVIDEAILLNKRNIDTPLAIETSGHSAFRDNFYIDDGMYLATKLVACAMKMKQNKKNLGSIIQDLREPIEQTEIRLDIKADDFRAAGQKIVEHLLDFASYRNDWHLAPDNREGVRISFDLGNEADSGWFLVRLSVHDPVMPINIESDVKGGLKELLALLGEALENETDIDLKPLKNYKIV